MQENHGHRWLRWPTDPTRARLGFGADYNPEQWPREVWDDDVRAMRAAGVNIVSLAIFSWARIQPRADAWDFAWLDEIMDLLHANGIAVDLATATASPPPWLTTAYPEILPVDREGRTLWPGGRQHWRPTSPIFREHALRLVRALAGRYGDHPALAAWHVNNELGCHNAYDYSDDAAAAFRRWLRARYGTVEALNTAWATTFWAQGYGDWAEILPPRLAASYPNPTQQLDFKRFSSDALKDHLRAERAVLRELTPDVPVTTNFMVMGETNGMHYADWAAEVDFVANDHYLVPGPQALDELSFSANLTGNIAGGRPWYLMEHSTSAVNWQPVNVPKVAGAMARDSLTHVAHGADAVCFFQWRQSAAGAEKYHSAMVPHAGTDSAVFRAVAELGARLRDLAEIAGTNRRPARAAIVFDWESWWVAEHDSHPTDRLRYRREALDWYTAFLNLGVRADVVPVTAELERYDLLVAPVLHVVPAALADRLRDYVTGGDTSSPPTSPASSTNTTTSGSAAIRARCGTCWASGSRSSGRCATGSGSPWTTAPPAPSGPTGSTSSTRGSRCSPGTPPAHRPAGWPSPAGPPGAAPRRTSPAGSDPPVSPPCWPTSPTGRACPANCRPRCAARSNWRYGDRTGSSSTAPDGRSTWPACPGTGSTAPARSCGPGPWRSCGTPRPGPPARRPAPPPTRRPTGTPAARVTTASRTGSAE
ncbi:hypothetical protein GCM10027605_32990 [Micromonospora zhanjiangensis]